MHLSNETLNGFWHASLEAARQYARLNLESAGQFLQAQAKYLAGIGQLGQEHRYLCPEQPEGSGEQWLRLLASHLDFSAEAVHSHLDNAAEFQDAFARIAREQLASCR